MKPTLTTRPTSRRMFLRQSGLVAGALVLARSGIAGSALHAHTGVEPPGVLPPRPEAPALARIAGAALTQSGFAAQLPPQTRLYPDAMVLAKGDAAVVAIPTVHPITPAGSVFVALIDRISHKVQGTLAWSIAALASRGPNRPPRYHARVWLDRRPVLDGIVDVDGRFVSGWLHDGGRHRDLTGRSYVPDGQAQAAHVQSDLLQDLASPPPSQVHAQSLACINTCLAENGVPVFLLGVAGALCTIACAITVGLGCWVCITAVLGGYIGAAATCLAECGYLTRWR